MKIAHDIKTWDKGGFMCSCGKNVYKKYGYRKSWAYEAMAHVPDKESFRIMSADKEPK